MNRRLITAVAAAAILAAIAGAWWLTERRPITSQDPAAAVSAAPTAAAASAAPPDISAGIRHPIDPSPAAEPVEAEPTTVEGLLTRLFGRQAVLSLFQLDDFPRRVAATVDSLGRTHASARVWPVNPAEGPFTVLRHDGQEVISPDNGMRYTPYVLLLESIDMRQAAATYRKLYPRFQQAHEALGYPNSYFNDRVVDLIDHLLATPDAAGPLAVRLPEIKGPVQPVRPWVLYEFADPRLEALLAGQKLLLRMGPVNQRRVKSKLAAFRQLIAAPSASPSR